MAKIKKTGRHTSALKAHRQSLRHRSRNFHTRGVIKDARKGFLAALNAKDTDKAKGLLVEAYSIMDKAAKNGVVHWRSAARKKSFLARKLTQLTAPKAA